MNILSHHQRQFINLVSESENNRSLKTKAYMHKIGSTHSGICSFCGNTIEILTHIFVKCHTFCYTFLEKYYRILENINA